MEIYNKLYKDYKDKVIDNYEYWFAQDVLIDISEGGGFDTLIDEQYEFLFNVELSRDLHNIIEELLFEQEKAENLRKSDEYKELLIQFLKLKRITDNKILESKEYDEDYVNEYIFNKYLRRESEKTDEIHSIQLNVKLLTPEILITDIYTFLSDNEYIDCPIDLFKKHFLGDFAKEKILWIGKQTEITAFIQLLYDYNIISRNKERGKKVMLTIKHFDFKNSKQEFKAESIGKEFSTFKKDDTLFPEIRNFFKKLNTEDKIKFK